MRVAVQVFHVTTELSRREYTAPALLMVGRHSECEVHVDDDQASRSHARLTLGPTSFILSDTSQNGTFLENGEIVHREHRELPYGTRLHIGAIRVLVAEATPEQPARQPPRQLSGPTLVSGEDALAAAVVADEAGLGPLEALLADATIEEIEVIDPGAIYVVRGGHRERATTAFADEARARVVLDRFLARAGVDPEAEGTLFDVRLPDGAHLVAMRRPLAERGTCLHLRKAPERKLDREAAVREGFLSSAQLAELENAVAERRGVLVTGEAGSGRTTLLRLLAGAVSASETILMIEETSELGAWQPRVVAMALRPGGTSAREAIRAAAVFRPDRLVVGDCRGAEAVEILGAPGALVRCPALAAIRATTPEDGLAQLVELASANADRTALGAAVLQSIGLVVHVAREGARRRVRSIQRPSLGAPGKSAPDLVEV